MAQMDEQNKSDPNWKTPKALTSMPDVCPIFEYPYVEAFYLLDSSRPIGMGLGTIPLSEITNLYDRIQLGEEMDFIKILQAADFAYLKAYNEDPKNQLKK